MNLKTKLRLKNYDDMPVNIGRLETKIENVTHLIVDVKKGLNRIQKRLELVERESNIWRGGVSVLLGFGTLAGAISAYVLHAV